jgi:hypothetical protein
VLTTDEGDKMPDLSVPYHAQETSLFCGPACVQMALGLLGVGGLTQTDLYNVRCHDDCIERGWATSPNGLQKTLNNHRPASFPGYFSIFGLGNTELISRKIVWTIHHYQAAAIALVMGNDHWVVVRGYEASAEPASSTDTSYGITSFYLNDPADGLGADHSIPYDNWLRSYMTGVPDGVWANQFIAACDSDPPPVVMGKAARPARRRRLRGDRILKPRRAGALALAGLAASGFLQRESSRRRLLNAYPVNPILVERLDCMDTFYYLVPFEVRPGAVVALVCIDARFGDYLQSALLPERGNRFHDLSFDLEFAREILFAQPIDFGRQGRLLKVRREAYALYPTLVWKPCRESMSPYLPFFMATIGNRQVYVRVDGQVFTRLHTHERGI